MKALLAWLRRIFPLRSEYVSPRWLTDCERRSWGVGLDQTCWTWPDERKEP